MIWDDPPDVRPLTGEGIGAHGRSLWFPVSLFLEAIHLKHSEKEPMSHGFCQVLVRYGDERETEPALRARELWMVLGPGTTGTEQRGAKRSSPIWGLSNGFV